MDRDLRLRLRATGLFVAGAAAVFMVTTAPALAVDQVHDEIQVYNAEIAEVGQWTYEQHLNYAAIGQTQPEFPGGFTSNHSLQGTPEFAYGITDWWEGGFYLPFAVTGTGEFLSDGAKIRSLFVIPDAAKRSFFYGVNFEIGYEMPQFAPTPWALEIRPIIGVRNASGSSSPIRSWTLASARPAKQISLQRCGLPATLERTASSASNIIPTLARSAIFCRCANSISNCTRWPISRYNKSTCELGVGHGFTPGSDRLMFKAIIGYAFPVPGKSDDSGNSANAPLAMGTSARPLQNPLITK